MTKQNIYSFALAGAIIMTFAFAVVMFSSQTAQGSVSVTDEYQATSTAQLAVWGGGTAQIALIKSGTGSIGSVIFPVANIGTLSVYDATTTNASFRLASKATSTLLIAHFPATTPAGVYTLDVEYSDGLLYVWENGAAVSTSTITYR